MIRRFRHYVIASLAVVLSACATTPPFSEEILLAVDRTLTPEQAVQNATQGVRVLWGGVIIGAENLPDHTDLTVLFYPLDKSQQPDLDKTAKNRFIVHSAGYLEAMVYAPGRVITVLGSLQGVEEGKVGDAPYRFPVLKAEEIYLWSLDENSKVHFGVGVGIGVHL